MITVVLIRPETEGNIGAVARVMLNFGFEDLVLVEPCEIGEECTKRAKHAKDVLENAEKWEKMDWDRFDLTIATSSETGGDYNVRRNAITPETLKDKLSEVEGDIALVFGPESKGLLNEEVEKSDILCHIPANDDYPVFNLSHAVAVILYELSKGSGEEAYELAGEEKRVLSNQLKKIVDKVNVDDYRREPVYLSLKNVFGRSLLSKREANTLLGFFRRVKNHLKEKDRS